MGRSLFVSYDAIGAGVGRSEPISIDETRTRLDELVARAAAGEEILIATNGVAIARLAPLAALPERRKPAGALGATWIADDFDAPLPEALQRAFDGEA